MTDSTKGKPKPARSRGAQTAKPKTRSAAKPKTASRQKSGKTAALNSASVDEMQKSALVHIKPGMILRQRFEILEEIGRGGLSLVFKAKDLVADKAGLANSIVAIKTILADEHSDPDLVALMHREARRIRDLVHPNIVRVHDMDVEDEIHFMVMEHLQGRTLAQMLGQATDHKLPAAQVDKIVKDIASGLAHAHANNIIHADLKPGNIFIETTGRVRLIDFNIAYPVARPHKQDEEDTVHILGRLGALTPAYASVQRLAGAEPTEGDDVYSLAVLALITLTGERPFGALTAREALEQARKPAISEDLPWWRRRALSRALSHDDSTRTPTVRQFAGEFLGDPRTVAGSLLFW